MFCFEYKTNICGKDSIHEYFQLNESCIGIAGHSVGNHSGKSDECSSLLTNFITKLFSNKLQ